MRQVAAWLPWQDRLWLCCSSCHIMLHGIASWLPICRHADGGRAVHRWCLVLSQKLRLQLLHFHAMLGNFSSQCSLGACM